MSETFTVYALFDTRAPDVVRYIGFSKDPAARLRAHVWEARRSRKRSHRLHWLRELDRDALKPQWRTLSVFETVDEAAQAEIAFIRQYREIGCALVNGTEGGEGAEGWGGTLSDRQPWSDERRQAHAAALQRPDVKARMSASAKARPPSRLGKPGNSPTAEHRAKLSAALTGRSKTPEHAAKVGAWHKGKPKSAEVRAKISATKTGNTTLSQEARMAISEKLKGIQRSPETRERMREAQRRRFKEQKLRRDSANQDVI